jgi:hypothetical protein
MTDAYGTSQNAGASSGIPDAYGKSVVVANSPIRTIPGASYTVKAADSGYTLVFTSGSAVTVIVPKGLGPNFVCALIQAGAGQVGFAAGAGAALNSAGGLVHLNGQWATGMLQSISADNVVLAGTLA